MQMKELKDVWKFPFPNNYHKSNYKVKHSDSTISGTTFLTRFIPLPSYFHKGQNLNNSAIAFLSNCPLVVRWLWEESVTHVVNVEA